MITNKQLLFERDACAGDAGAAERVLVAVNADDAPFTFGDGSLAGRFEVLLASAPVYGNALIEDGAGEPARLLAGDVLELDGSLEIPPFGVLYLKQLF